MFLTYTFFFSFQFFLVLLVILGLVISAAAVGFQNRDKVGINFICKKQASLLLTTAESQ